MSIIGFTIAVCLLFILIGSVVYYRLVISQFKQKLTELGESKFIEPDLTSCLGGYIYLTTDGLRRYKLEKYTLSHDGRYFPNNQKYILLIVDENGCVHTREFENLNEVFSNKIDAIEHISNQLLEEM